MGVGHRMNAAEVRGLLWHKYAGDKGWHVENEVTVDNRRLDVVAFNLWGARQYRTVGFEIKVQRGDWLSELRDFRKSAEWTSIVDQFYVVAPKGLIKADEVPRGWGYLEVRGTRFFTVAQPETRSSGTMPRELMARYLLRMKQELTHAQNAVGNKEYRVTAKVREEIRREERARLQEKEAEEQAAVRATAEKYTTLLKTLGLAQDWRPDETIVRVCRLVGRSDVPQLLQRLIHELEFVSAEALSRSSNVKELRDALSAGT